MIKTRLRNTLWVSLLLGALVPAIVVGTYLLKQISELDRQHVTQTLYLKANTVAKDILRQIEGSVSDLVVLSQVPDISLTPVSAIFGYQANLLISEFLIHHPWAAAVYIVDRNGEMIEGAPLAAELLDLSPYQNILSQLRQQVAKGDVNPMVQVYQEVAFANLLEQDQEVISSYGVLIAQPILQTRMNSLAAVEQTGALLVMVPLHSFWKQIEPKLDLNSSLDIFYSEDVLLSADKGESKVQRFIIDVDLDWPRLPEPITLSLGSEASSLWKLMLERRANVILMLGLSLLLVSILALFLTQRIVEPLHNLGLFVRQYALGLYHLKAPALRYSEFDAVARLLESMGEKVKQEQALLEQRVEDRTHELKSANQALQETLEQLSQTQLKLIEQEKMAALGGLVSGVAHELNTPLGVCVSAASQLDDNSQLVLRHLADGRLSKTELEHLMEQNKEGCDLLARSLQRAANLVNTFKAIAGSDIDLSVKAFKLKTWCESQIPLLGHDVVDKRLRFEVEGDNPCLEVNQRALELVLETLVDNSIQHGFVQQAQPFIQLRIEAKPELVILYYQDNGAGVSEENRELIFNPFFTTGRGSGSVGLGLNQVFNLVHHHLNGDISSYPVSPQGLGFTISIPI